MPALLSFIKNKSKGKAHSYANNAFAKRFSSYDEKIQIILKDLIFDYDAGFIIAQLTLG
ncbi:MAG: hypothetical protein ACYCZ2_02240 [Lutibacter sp.]